MQQLSRRMSRYTTLRGVTARRSWWADPRGAPSRAAASTDWADEPRRPAGGRPAMPERRAARHFLGPFRRSAWPLGIIPRSRCQWLERLPRYGPFESLAIRSRTFRELAGETAR